MGAEEHRSPIERLYAGWNQYGTFKAHLMLPFPYLRVIVKNYRDLTEVPIKLPGLLSRIDAHLWSTMQDVTYEDKIFKAKGVPVPYLREDAPPAAGVKVLKALELILADLPKFVRKPIALHLHSGFETSALIAASTIVKQAIREGIDARMLGFGTFLNEVKEFDGRNEVVAKARSVQLLCLHMVGKEYRTEFTRAALEALLAERAVEGKVTLITSHLDPAAFQKRYDFELSAVALKFEDEKITKTVDQLIAYMKGE